ncbi:tetratricopeptide repeat protein [Methanolobus sp.]|uniref:tetratricopeptide repeat protein n=1 Tax=Methanolobus sp. TaxID=1874737 RepID=UPI0025F10F07|nr:tetratricopeptide repeat protein [Methanolobus sp.]
MWAEELVETGEYSSITGVINIAMAEYRMGHPSPSEVASLDKDLWRMKGKALQELGNLEEAIKCFDIALGI